MCSLRVNWNAFSFHRSQGVRVRTSPALSVTTSLNSLYYHTSQRIPESRCLYTDALTDSVGLSRARKCPCRGSAPVSSWWTSTGRQTSRVASNPNSGLSATMRKRFASSKVTASSEKSHHLDDTLSSATAIRHEHDHDHHHHEHNHEMHTHTHGVFGFGGHDHNHEHSRADAEKFIETLKGGGDRGSRITLIGLFANVGLTAAKGAAGWFLHSASLLADAGHSLSDLLGDFVTLFCWRLSRQPKSPRYPYGYGKFETIGTVTVSLLLVGGALGIGFHSYNLLLEALYPSIQLLQPGLAHDILQTIVHTTSNISSHATEHGAPDPGNILDPNAAWFAAVSVVAKEWLYRATKKVADDEHSGVLMANAIHHRSDAYSSLVALIAILGTWLVPGLPLDPLGGLVVSFVILGQGLGLLQGGFNQLVDRGVSDKTRTTIIRQLNPLFDPSTPSLQLKHLTAIRDVRAVRSGALMFVDLVAVLPPQTTMVEAYFVQQQIRERLFAFKKEISEVRVKMIPDDVDVDVESTSTSNSQS